MNTTQHPTRRRRERLSKLTDDPRFGVYSPGEFRSPQGQLWLAFVHGMGWGFSGGQAGHGWLVFRCMRTGQHVTLPMDGSWKARRVGWDHIELELGIEDPQSGRHDQRRWEPAHDQLEFSPIARGVYELARARDLPDAGEIRMVARELDYRAERNPAFGDGFGGASYGWARLAEEVLDCVLPPIGEHDLHGKPERRTVRPLTPTQALRAVITAAATGPMYGTRAKGPTEPILTAAQTWRASGWKDAASELNRHIALADERFEARRHGERDGQGALFNSVALAR
jgi:hypothetical protein